MTLRLSVTTGEEIVMMMMILMMMMIMMIMMMMFQPHPSSRPRRGSIMRGRRGSVATGGDMVRRKTVGFDITEEEQ